MPVLQNPRHERFAQELAKGKSQTEAYGLAGYKEDRTAASRLSTNVNVRARVAELQQKTSAKVEITLESLLSEAGELQRLAAAAEQFGAANGALKLKAELSGHYVARKEDVTVRRTPQQIHARLSQIAAAEDPGRGGGTDRGTGPEHAGDEALPTVPGHGTA